MEYSIAAIFDLDGVVADTIGSLHEIYSDIAKTLGLASSQDEFNYLNGLNIEEISFYLEKKTNSTHKKDDIKNMFIERFQYMYEKVKLIPGVMDTLESLHKNDIKIGLASSSKRHNIDTLLNKFNIRHFFDFIVSGDDVVHSKPDPEIYYIAKKHSKCDFCFAIEDSINGLKSAKMAGLICIHYNPDDDRTENINAEYTIKKLEKVQDIILKKQTILISANENIKLAIHKKKFEISEYEKEQANKTWNLLTKENPHLFNGDIAIYVNHKIEKDSSLTISCSESEYKYFLSKKTDKSGTRLAPIGVSGILIDASGKVLIGKRNNNLSQYANCYEFVPSGSITKETMSDDMFLEQIKIELYEETGIQQQHINEISPICFIYDKVNGIFDIGVKLTLKEDLDITLIKSDEYTDLQFLSIDSLNEFFTCKNIVPTCIDMLYILSRK